MTTLTLNQIEGRVKNNMKKNKSAIERFENSLRKSNLRKGRVRPKDPTEAKILSMFNKK